MVSQRAENEVVPMEAENEDLQKGTNKKIVAKPKKLAAKSRHLEHPTYLVMALSAFDHAKESGEVNFRSSRAGLSFNAIVKYIIERYELPQDTKSVNATRKKLANALKKALDEKVLAKATGLGMTGSFRMGPNYPGAEKKTPNKPTMTGRMSTVSTQRKAPTKKVATPASKKTPAKKMVSPATKTASVKLTSKKAPARKMGSPASTSKKAPAKKIASPATKKAPVKKVTSKKAPAKKMGSPASTSKKAPAKKIATSATKKAPVKAASRKAPAKKIGSPVAKSAPVKKSASTATAIAPKHARVPTKRSATSASSKKTTPAKKTKASTA